VVVAFAPAFIDARDTGLDQRKALGSRTVSPREGLDDLDSAS